MFFSYRRRCYGCCLLFSLSTEYGEVWTDASWLQLAGLLVLLFGTAVYNGSIITFDDETSNAYSRIDAMEMGATQHGTTSSSQSGLIKTEKSMASPALQRSPLIYRQLEEEAGYQEARAKDRSASIGSYQSTAQQAKSLELESNIGKNNSGKAKAKGNKK